MNFELLNFELGMRTSDPARVQRIIDSAARLFAQRHYHEVRMDDIAAQAEVAKGTLYLHFKTKEDLYAGLILSCGNQLLEKLDAQVHRDGPPAEKLEAFIREVIHFFDSYPYFLELVQRIEGALPAGQDSPLRTNRDRFFRLLTGLLKEFDAHCPDAGLAALALMGMLKEVIRFQQRPLSDCLPAWIVRQFLHGFIPTAALGPRSKVESQKALDD